MRIKKTKSKFKEHYSIIFDTTINGKRTTKVYENLGSLDNIKFKSGKEDPLTWLKNYVEELNKKVKEESLPIIVKKHPNNRIKKDEY